MSKILYNPTFSEINTIYKKRKVIVPIRKSVEVEDEIALFLSQVYPFLIDKTPYPVVAPAKKTDIPKAFGKKIKRRMV